MTADGTVSTEFPRREVATRRVEWIIKPPDPEVGEEDYDRYENDRYKVMQIIEAMFEHSQPHDLRVIEREDETVISYEIQRVIIH